MIAAQLDLDIQLNRDFKQMFIIPYAISDLTFTSEIRDSETNALITAFSVDKDTVNNYLFLSLQDSITKTLSGNLNYDIKQTDSSGFDKTIIKGFLNLNKTITQ